MNQVAPTIKENLQTAAIEYATRGFKVFPCKLDKAPYTPNGFKDAVSEVGQISTWWKRWPDALIGFPCKPNGLLVIDIDNKDGRDGNTDWKNLVEALSGEAVQPSWMQATRNGGFHLFFKHPDFDISQGKLAPGIDVRSKAYVIISPSPGYTWVDGLSLDDGELIPPPEWMANLLKPTFESKRQTVQGGDKERWSAELLDRLAGWRCDDYFEWVNVGMALSELGDAGLKLWDTWSRASSKYKPGDCAKKWRGFEPGHGLSLGSLYYWASIDDPQTSRLRVHPVDGNRTKLTTPGNGRPESKARRKHPLGTEYVDFLKSCGYQFRLCELDDSLWVNDSRMTDVKESELKTILRDGGYRQVNVALDAVLAHAAHSSFHPVRDFLTSLEWDGKDHIAKLAGYILDKHEVFPLILRKWLIGAVARPMTGGKQNKVMVLEGTQGVGKSYFARWLGSVHEDYFSEAMPSVDDKDSRLALAMTWIWEIKELGAVTRRADLEALKAWLTLETISERPPFGKYPIHKPSMTSFIATVNDAGGFFNDPTGSRRYMTAALVSLDWDYSQEIDPLQVWAQAFSLFEKGETWDLTPEESRRVQDVNDLFEFTPPVYDYLDLFVQPAPEVFTPAEELTQALRAEGLSGTDAFISRQVAGWMKRNCYESGRSYIEVDTVDKSGTRYTKQKQVRGYFGCELQKKAAKFFGT